MVMPLGLTNPPRTCQDMINHILNDLLDEGLLVYINSVLIYTTKVAKYNLLVKQVLNILAENNLVISLDKCIWTSERVKFLRYVIMPDGTEMAQDKIIV
jgi:hypothetical protein